MSCVSRDGCKWTHLTDPTDLTDPTHLTEPTDLTVSQPTDLSKH